MLSLSTRRLREGGSEEHSLAEMLLRNVTQLNSTTYAPSSGGPRRESCYNAFRIQDIFTRPR
jgi:hypothetical protein